MDPKFIVNLSGKEHVLYAGLLAEAHDRGLLAIETQVIQIPAEENSHTAIARAVVRLKDGTSFEEFGDANPKNVNPRIATALLRMALTRAKGRALRDAVNVGVAMVEELPDLEEHGAASRPHGNGREPGKERAAATVARTEQPMPVERKGEAVNPACVECGVLLTPGQMKVSQGRFKLNLCPSHQKEAAKTIKEAAGAG